MPGTGSAMTARLGLSSGRGSDTSSIEPAREPLGLADGLAVEHDVAVGGEVGGLGAGDPEEAGDAGVDALALEAVGDEHGAHVRHLPRCDSASAAGARVVASSCVRWSGRVCVDRRPRSPEQREDDDERRPRRDDPDVGDVADEPAVVVDEVDDVTLARRPAGGRTGR